MSECENCTALRAENERLRAALDNLLSAVDALPPLTVDPHSVRDARAALEEKP